MLLTGSTGKPRVILGTMTFGPEGSEGARVTSLDEYNKCLDYLQSKGYMEIDTVSFHPDLTWHTLLAPHSITMLNHDANIYTLGARL